MNEGPETLVVIPLEGGRSFMILPAGINWQAKEAKEQVLNELKARLNPSTVEVLEPGDTEEVNFQYTRAFDNEGVQTISITLSGDLLEASEKIANAADLPNNLDIENEMANFHNHIQGAQQALANIEAALKNKAEEEPSEKRKPRP